MKVERRALYGLMLVALLLRLAPWGWFADLAPRIYDERDYDRVATSLATSGEFASRGERTSFRPPLYPAMVALVYRAAGVGDHQAVRLAQIVLGIALVPIVHALGSRLYDERTGLLAAALAIFYPSLWGHSYLLLTEVAFTLLLCAGTLALVGFPTESGGVGAPAAVPVSAASHQRWWLAAAGGALFGLASLTRSSVFLYPPVLAIVLFGLWNERQSRRVAAVLVFVAAFAVVVAPWIARNSKLHGRLSPIDSNAGFTTVKFSPVLGAGDRGPRRANRTRRVPAPDVRSAQAAMPADGPRPPEAAAPLEDAGAPGAANAPGAASAGAASAGAPTVASTGAAAGARARDPNAAVRAARGVALNALAFWRIDREIVGAAARGWLGPIPRPAVLAMAGAIGLYYVLLLLAGVFGVVLRPPASRLQLAIVLSVVAVLAGVHTLSIGHSRYHIPIMPLIAVFAARWLLTWRAPAPRRRVAAAAAIAAALVASWLIGLVTTDRADLERHLPGEEREVSASDGAG